MRKFLFAITTVFFTLSLQAQGLYRALSLDQRVEASSLIVEAEVMRSEAVLHANGQVYTHHLLKVSRLFKGALNGNPEIVTLGGAAGGTLMKVFPALQLEPGMKGIFFLTPDNVIPRFQDRTYKAYADRQGFVAQLWNGKAFDGLKDYGAYEEVFVKRLRDEQGLSVKVLAKQSGPMSPVSAIVPSVISFSPDSIAAGEFQILSIRGVGFGNYTGQADVRFRNADDGGISFVSAPSSQIILWTDTLIQVEVPFRAGSGSFMVVDQNGASTLSNTDLLVRYDIINLQTGSGIQYSRLVDINGLGGLSFVFNTNFYSNTDAKNAFNRALESWRCNTMVNFASLSNTTDSSCNSRNNISVVAFDTDCPLDPGVLGRAYSYYTICQDEDPELVEVDILFDEMPANGWHFGASAPAGTSYDFESVALHELGHAHQMGHVIDANAVMHYSLPAGTARKTPDANDILAGESVMARSVKDPVCGYTGMLALTVGNCQFTIPVASFDLSPDRGCVPFDVQFTDASTSLPTSWAWDFDNDGVIDDTTQNPVHTYSTPGIYSVRLIVSNANGSDTLTRINVIQAYASPAADAGPDLSICPDGRATIGGAPTGSGGTGFLRYQWLPAESLNNAALPNPEAAPMNTTEYTVEVSDDNGCKARDSMVLTVMPGPVLDIGGDRTVCEGDTVRLINQAGNAAGTIFRWSPPDGIDDPSNDTTIMIAAGSSVTLTLSAQTPNGCQAQASFLLTIRRSPVVDAGEDQTSCSGTGVEIGGHPSASGGSGGYTYLWQPFAGLSNSGAANPIADPAATTTYTLTVFDALGCSRSDTVRVEVAPSPVADAGPDLGPVCAGQALRLGGQPTGSGGTGALFYTWLPTAYLDTINIANPLATPEQSTLFKVIVVDANGCRAEDSVFVSIWPTPVADAGRDTVFCGPGTLTLGGSPAGSGGTAPLAYSWSPDSGLSQNNIPNPLASPVESTEYTLTVSDANQCASSDVVNVTVLPALAANAGAEDTLCYGECIHLGGNPPANGGSGTGYSYEWRVDTGIFSLDANPEICPAATQSYTLMVYDPAGCEAEAVVRILVKNYQPIDFRTIDSSYCTNDGYDSLIAFPVGGNFSGPGIRGNGFYPDEAGTGMHWIFYEYMTGNGCLIRDSFLTEVRPSPDKPVVGQKGDTLYTSDTFWSYQWIFNGIALPNTDMYYYVAPESGNYQVKVFSEAGCENISDIYSFSVGIENRISDLSIALYPVPNDGHFVLRLKGKAYASLSLEIFDLSGRKVLDRKVQMQERRLDTEIDISSVSSGVYMLKISSGEGMLLYKFAVTK